MVVAAFLCFDSFLFMEKCSSSSSSSSSSTVYTRV